MKKIYKYELPIESEPVVLMPKEAKILKIAEQYNHVFIWAEVNPDNQNANYFFRVFGTGHPKEDDENLKYIDSVLVRGGELVWHIFLRENT